MIVNMEQIEAITTTDQKVLEDALDVNVKLEQEDPLPTPSQESSNEGGKEPNREPANICSDSRVEHQANETSQDRYSPVTAATQQMIDQVKKESVYDAVVGANDQELAKRQYVADDDEDEDEHVDLGPKSKRLATSSNVSIPRENDENSLKEDSTTTNGCSKHHHHHYHADGHDNGSGEQILNDESNSFGLANRNADEPEQMRKLFIGGLDYKTSEETLWKHFEKFGHVIDCVVMRESQSKRSRGFGFVIYANSSMVDKAQLARPHEVDGREVQSKRAISREDSGKPEAQATVKKVYLGGLSDDIEESELRDYFKEFGNIVNINIVAHKDTGKPRGFAFVEYDDYDPVDKIVLKKFHLIRDKRVEAKKAIPKVEMDARKRVDPRSAMAGAMMSLSGPGGLSPSSLDGLGRTRRGGRSGGGSLAPGYLWDTPYGPSMHPQYPGGALDGYAPHFHPAASPHYGPVDWMSGQANANGPYGFRGSHGGNSGGGAYGRNSYPSQATAAAAAAASAAAATASGGWPDYGSFPAASSHGGGIGPMRLAASYQQQHRGYRPYANGNSSSSGYGAFSGGAGPAPRRSYHP